MSLNASQLVRLLGVDPGVTTGIAIHELLEDSVNPTWRREELGPDKHHQDLWKLLQYTQPSVIVCETFDYRVIRNRGVDMPGVRLESREYIGVLELWSQMYNVPLMMQPTSCKGDKALISPDKLKRLGLYQAPSGRQHMNDATAHLLHYIVATLKRRDYLDKLRPS